MHGLFILGRLVPVLVLLALLGRFINTGAQESISTRSTRAEGTLMCGKVPASKVYVRLFKTNSDEISNALATAVTNDQGKFIIEGNTANYQGSEANIDPFLKIYHKCDEKEGKKGYRRITLRYPREYVTIGRVPRRNYNVGNLNLVLQYPNEAHIDELKGI
ncbi:hypothetical protein niasHS_002016 [Heterodera schachtii]|uniref:Transthyretin-like family protein n=2 Tax=Heterodera TaxID=34509 RepID=A0ABD2K5K8_HETSC